MIGFLDPLDSGATRLVAMLLADRVTGFLSFLASVCLKARSQDHGAKQLDVTTGNVADRQRYVSCAAIAAPPAMPNTTLGRMYQHDNTPPLENRDMIRLRVWLLLSPRDVEALNQGE
jgi:hypothetical protein